MLFVVALVVLVTVTVTLGVIDSVPVVFVREEAVLKSMAIWMGVPLTRDSGKGEFVMVTLICESAGVSVHGEVVVVLLGHELVPSVNVVPELFSTVNCGLANVIVMPAYVPAGALVFASSVFEVARLDKFTVTGLGSSETFACPAVPVIETPVT